MPLPLFLTAMPSPRNAPVFRPPAEADSLILQVDQGCPYNRCTFCGMYRHTPFARRTLDEIRTLAGRAARAVPDARRVFLADGDAMSRPYAELETILVLLHEHFPGLARVNVYATGRAIRSKTDRELGALRNLKLHTLYLGLESGDDVTLREVRKGETAGGMVDAGRRAQANGLRVSVMILIGLGGQARLREHAHETAAALNAMQPRLLSALRTIPIAGTELHAAIAAGRFSPLTERQAVEELRLVVERLDLANTVFRANHSSNVVPLEGRLPRDRQPLLDQMDRQLASGHLDDRSPGDLPVWL